MTLYDAFQSDISIQLHIKVILFVLMICCLKIYYIEATDEQIDLAITGIVVIVLINIAKLIFREILWKIKKKKSPQIKRTQQV